MAKEASPPPRAPRAIISNTLRFFIILSVLAHFGAGLFWGIPSYILRESEREMARQEAETRAQMIQNAKRSAAMRHEAEIEKTKEDIAAELRKNLETMLNDQADAKTAKALEDRLLNNADLQKAMGHYASALLDGFASDEDLRNLAGELESEFVETVYEEYRDLHAELLAAEFLEHVQKEVAPKISEHYRQEFDGQIANPFKSEADKIASKAQQEEQARRNAVQGSLTQTKSKLEAAGNEIGQTRDHLRQGLGGDASQTAAGNGGGPSLDDALKSLQGARQAAEAGKAKAQQAGDTLGRANSRDAKAKQAAEQQAGQALDEAGRAVAEAAKAIAQAAPAAERFGGPAAQAMKTALDKAAQAVAETTPTTAPLTTTRAGEATRRAEALGAAVAEAQKTLQAAGTEFSKAGKNAASADAALNQGMEATRKGVEALAKGPEAPYAQATRQARDAVSTALDAVQATEQAIADGSGAPSQGAASNAAQAIAKGLESTQAAMVAVGKASVTDSWAKAGIENIVDTELRQAAEKAFTESLEKDAMPRLAKALSGSFRDKMRKNGITNEKVEQKVAVRIEELLDTQVAGGAGTGAAGDLGSKFRGYSGATAGDLPGQAASAIGQAAAAQAGAAQGKLLAERLPGISGDARADGRFAGLAGEFGDGNDMGLEDRLAKLAEGVKSGRVTLLGNGAGKGSAMVELRNQALGRAGNGSGSGSGSGRPGGRPGVGRGSPLRIDSEEYKRLMGLLENRDNAAAKGGQWNLAGAEGDASRAGAAEEYRAPAMVVDPQAASEKVNIKNAQPYEPTFKTIRFSSIPCLNKPFAMNGDFSKWKDLPSVQLQGEKHVDGQPDTQNLQMAWDATGLYFHLAIKKPGVPVHKVEQRDFPIGDGIEVWVDTLNSKEKSRDRNNGQQFWFWPFGSASDPNLSGGESIFSKKTGFNYQVYGPDQTQRAARQTPDGWEMECKIPCERLWDADLVPGRILGMNIYANTGTALNYYWSSSKNVGTWNFPNTWGDVLLAGSDGEVQVLDRKPPGGAPAGTGAAPEASGAKAPPTLVVGEPLRLRVTDKDMSGTEGRRGKVQVTVRARQGKAQTVILEETTPGRGVFEGAVRTALALDEEAPGTLNLFEGDMVDIVYNDQARANGARNAEVKIQARAGVAVLADVPSQRASAQVGGAGGK